MTTHDIPRALECYPEGCVPLVKADEVYYSPRDGENISVLLWERFPSYDMIFGVPTKDNPKYEKEMAFFIFRRAGGEHGGHYFDLKESKVMIDGFQRALNISRSHSPHLWDEKK